MFCDPKGHQGTVAAVALSWLLEKQTWQFAAALHLQLVRLCAQREVKMTDLDEHTSVTSPTLQDMAGLGDLSQLLSMWLDRCKAGELPARAAFDPLDMRKLLGRIVIVDVLSDPLRFRFRLVGTEWVTRFGFDPTNTLVEDFPRVQSRAFIKDVMSKTVQERVPLMVRRSVIIDNQYFRYGMLLMPLASDGKAVDMIMIGFEFPTA